MRQTRQIRGETREAILAAAERLLMEKDVSDVSLEEVAEAAGFTRGAVYWHFHSKAGLLLALLDRNGPPLQELANQLEMDPTRDPLNELVRVTSRLLGELEFNSQKKRLAVQLIAFADTRVPQHRRRLERNLRAAIWTIFRLAEKQQGLAVGWRPDIAALAFYTMLSGLVTVWLREENDFDLRTDVVAIIRAFAESVSGGKSLSQEA